MAFAIITLLTQDVVLTSIRRHLNVMMEIEPTLCAYCKRLDTINLRLVDRSEQISTVGS